MATAVETSLAEGVRVAAEDAAITLRGRRVGLSVPRPSPALCAAFEALDGCFLRDEALVALAGADAALLFYHLDAAAELGLLRWRVACDGAALLVCAPLTAPFARRSGRFDEDRPAALSRFAFTRVLGETIVLECPLSHFRITIEDRRAAALLHDLARPSTVRELADQCGDLGEDAVRAVCRTLAGAGMLEEDGGDSAEALRQWEFHDLLFHTRSRGARHGGAWGGNYRFAGRIAPLPAARPPAGGDALALFRPDLEELARRDPPLARVMERRRSVRAPGPHPITARQLGELLFRCARVRGRRESPVCELTDRPYPGAGALYELEIYPVVHHCDGIEAGMYRYCPFAHRLERTPAVAEAARDLLEAARTPDAEGVLPDVLLVLAARFQRIAWKYEAIAYALILKDAGVLLQSISLAATAMSLSACALGHGDPDRFCRAAGTDPYVEASVAEIALWGGGDPR